MYKVYLVDDEPLQITSLMTTISWPENGFEVIGSSTSPTDALTAIPPAAPDVVFCDLKMPGMDGIQLIGALREQGLDCEYIMLSAFGEFEASREFFRLEGFDYLLKPLEEPEAELVLERMSRRLQSKHNITPTMTFSPTGAEAFDALVAYLTENYSKKHTLSTLSKQFGISTSYICNLFSKHYGSTLTIFMTDLRMREAARKIRDTDATLKESAIDCGYSDYFYFCRVFKGYYDATPSDYRQTGGET